MHKRLFSKAGLPIATLLLASVIVSGFSTAAVASPPLQPANLPKEDGWSAGQTGSDHKYTCPDDQAMIGRKHDGDENASIYYKCHTYAPYGVAGTLTATKTSENDGDEFDPKGDWSEWLDEGKPDSHDYTCPDGTVMTGQAHRGDENGDTRYRCSKFTLEGKVEPLVKGTTFTGEEGNHSFTCPTGQVFIGREHICEGARNACDYGEDTTYTCGYVRGLN